MSDFTSRELEFALNELGMSAAKFAEYKNMNTQSVYYYIKSNNIKRDKNKCLFDKGIVCDLEEVATQYGMPLELVSEGYRQFNTRYSLLSFEDAVRLVVNENKSATDIAEELGCSRQNIHSILNKYGIYKMLPTTEEGRPSSALLKIGKKSSKIEELYAQGRSVKYISEQVGVSVPFIYDYLKENLLYENRKDVDIDMEEFIDLYLQGFNCKEIADKLDINVSTLYRRLKTEGIKDYEFYKNKRTVDLDRDTVYDMYVNKNMSCNSIAEALGVSQPGMYAYMVREGIFKKIRNFDYIEYLILSDLGYSEEDITDKFKMDKESFTIAKLKYNEKIDRLKEIVDLRNKGESAIDIAYELDLNYANVLYYIRRYDNKLSSYI